MVDEPVTCFSGDLRLHALREAVTCLKDSLFSPRDVHKLATKRNVSMLHKLGASVLAIVCCVLSLFKCLAAGLIHPAILYKYEAQLQISDQASLLKNKINY